MPSPTLITRPTLAVTISASKSFRRCLMTSLISLELIANALVSSLSVTCHRGGAGAVAAWRPRWRRSHGPRSGARDRPGWRGPPEPPGAPPGPAGERDRRPDDPPPPGSGGWRWWPSLVRGRPRRRPGGGTPRRYRPAPTVDRPR